MFLTTMGENDGASQNSDTVDARMMHYLKTCSLKRILELSKEIQEEIRETGHVVQTLAYDTYGQFVSLFVSLCSKTSDASNFCAPEYLDEITGSAQELCSNYLNCIESFEPLLTKCSMLEKKQTLVNHLLRMASLPEGMQKDIKQGKYLSAVDQYKVYKNFLVSHTSKKYFHTLLQKCEQLHEEALAALYSSLRQTYDPLDSCQPSLTETFPDFIAFYTGLHYLVESKKYPLDLLGEKWSCCIIKLLSEILHKTCVASVDCFSQFETLLNLCCTETLPHFLDCVKSCVTLFPEAVTEATQKNVTLDGVRLILNIFHREALKEDLSETVLETIKSQLNSALNPVLHMKRILQAYDEFLQSFMLLLMKNKLKTIWCTWFQHDFMALLEHSGSYAFDIGTVDAVLHPTKKELHTLRLQCQQASDSLSIHLQLCMKDWKEVVNNTFSSDSNEWIRLCCEIHYTLSSLFDPLQKIVTCLLDNTGALSDHNDDSVLVSISPFTPLAKQTVSYSLPPYHHLIGLSIVTFLQRFEATEIEKIETISAELFRSQDHASSCSMKQECSRLSQYVLQQVTERWGRELTYLFTGLTFLVCGQESSSSTWNSSSLDQINCNGLSLLVYEAMRTSHIFAYLFDPREPLPNSDHTECTQYVLPSMDPLRHNFWILKTLERGVLSRDFLDAKKLVTYQETITNVSCISESLDSIFVLLSSTVFRGILQLLRQATFYPLPLHMAKFLQLNLIVLRDFLRPLIKKDTSRALNRCHGHSSLTSLSNHEDLFALSDIYIEQALYWIITHCSSEAPASSTLLSESELYGQLKCLRTQGLNLLNS